MASSTATRGTCDTSRRPRAPGRRTRRRCGCPAPSSSPRRTRSRGISLTQATSRLVLANMRWRTGSYAAPPQFTPPTLPGTTTVPRRLGGVKIPSERERASMSRHHFTSSGVGPHASSGVNDSGTSEMVREGLGRPALLPRDVGLGDRALLHRQQRLAVAPVEDEHVAHLRVHHHCRACRPSIRRALAARRRRSPRGRGAPPGTPRRTHRSMPAARRPSWPTCRRPSGCRRNSRARDCW